MKMIPIVCLLSLLSAAAATGPVPVSRSGLAGIGGFYFYNPYCAHGCFRSFSIFPLSCSETISPGGGTTADEAARNLAVCRANSFPYLSSIAWCIRSYCPKNVLPSTIEKFWETEMTGDVNIVPRWSYGETLANITEPPTVVRTNTSSVLDMTVLTTYDTWFATQNTLRYFFRETALESYLGLSLCLTAFGLPIVLTWLGYLPYMSGISGRAKPWLYSNLVGAYQNRTLPFNLGNPPTIGQGAYIAALIILNIIFLAVGYKTAWPRQENQWYADRYQELMAYFMWRTGVLAFCQMPVLFLFSTRNNILLWITGWSHSTYLLLHRWVARLFLLQALLHSLLALVLYQRTGAYAASLMTEWWIWGCVATVAAVAIVLASALVLRRRAYEVFLALHIILAVICVVGCWYHVWYAYENTFGYETWLYATIAVWVFDRVARVARILKVGLRWARVVEVTPSVVRVDVPGIRWDAVGNCAYAYFPTLSFTRALENHPFSVIPTAILDEAERHHTRSVDNGGIEKDPVRNAGVSSLSSSDDKGQRDTSGITLFVRKGTGLTSLLSSRKRLLTLLDGPYPTNPTRTVLRTDRLLLIGGGIGITGLLPYLQVHGNVKLCYSANARDQGLVDCMSNFLYRVRDREISVGKRLDVEELLQAEVDAGWAKVGIVVCGPAGMCDHVRAVTSRVGKRVVESCLLELEVDTFSL